MHRNRPTSFLSVSRRYGVSFAIALTLGIAVFSGQSPITTLAATATATTCANATPAVAPLGSPPAGAAAIPTEAAIQPEQNPAGDIPDNQAFVTYTSSAGGYSVEMPEGWARLESGSNVTFSDKLHQFGVTLGCAAAAPTISTAKVEASNQLASAIPAFQLVDIKVVNLAAGAAVLIQYQANSAPDDVTGKQHRIDVDRYEFFRNGKLAVLSIASPAGSDNVDVSRQVSESFRWLV